MIKSLRAIGAILALLTVAYTAPALAQPAASAPAPLAHPALWQVTGPNATIYLFGTVHLLPADVRWLDGTVAAAFAHADTLVTEILNPTPAALRPILAAKAMLPAGRSLREMLAPGDRQRLEAALAADHLPVNGMDRFRPWFAALTLATVPMLQLGYDPANGVDARLSKLAQARTLPHEALENAEFQLGLFAGLPPPVQKAYLLEVMKQLPTVKAELAGIIAAWDAGKAGDLAKLMNSDEDDPQMMQVLLFDRNRTWAKWIQARLAKPGKPHETLFIAVGAGHLAGPGSVLDDLHALGIASRRLQ